MKYKFYMFIPLFGMYWWLTMLVKKKDPNVRSSEAISCLGYHFMTGIIMCSFIVVNIIKHLI